MKKIVLLTCLSLLTMVSISGSAFGQTPDGGAIPQRPRLIGVSHACFYTADMDRTVAFFTDYLGYEVAGDGLTVPGCTIIKFNDRQFIELFPDTDGTRNNQMHYALETDDAEAWRVYLLAQGYDVPREPLTPGRTGNLNFFVPVVDGVPFEIIQYLPEGMIMRSEGKFLPEGRVTDRMGHIGFMVDDMDAVNPFYTGVMGLRETWRGGSRPDVAQWIHMRLPESSNTVEYMLYDTQPSQAQRGVMNHICLWVSDCDEAHRLLSTRTLPEGCRGGRVALGADNLRQVNLYTHEGIRVELVEDHYYNGVPAPSTKGRPMKLIKN